MTVKNRGFASVKSVAKRKALAKLGGQAAWKKGVAHRWDPEEARKAGKLGLKSRIAKGGTT